MIQQNVSQVSNIPLPAEQLAEGDKKTLSCQQREIPQLSCPSETEEFLAGGSAEMCWNDSALRGLLEVSVVRQ